MMPLPRLQVGVALQVDEMLPGRKTLFENLVFGAQVSAVDCPPALWSATLAPTVAGAHGGHPIGRRHPSGRDHCRRANRQRRE